MNDLINRRKAFEYFVTLWECIGTIMDREEWEDVCMTTANEIPSAQPDLSEYIDKLWRSAYERGKRDAQPEIIHCRDCKWHNGEINQCNAQVCASMCGDDFCSRAEKREE